MGMWITEDFECVECPYLVMSADVTFCENEDHPGGEEGAVLPPEVDDHGRDSGCPLSVLPNAVMKRMDREIVAHLEKEAAEL